MIFKVLFSITAIFILILFLGVRPMDEWSMVGVFVLAIIGCFISRKWFINYHNKLKDDES